MTASRNIPVLIIEDDPLIGELLVGLLAPPRYKPSWTPSGLDGLRQLRHLVPQLVILDLGLPGLDGFQVLKDIRVQPRFRRTPILMLTARHTANDVVKAIECGATDFVAKPFESPALLKRIEGLLQLDTAQ